MRMGSFFSGIGVLDLGFHRAGMDIAWTCEVDPFRRSILEKRWPEAKHYDDIRTFKPGRVEPVDLVVGAFPPEGFSSLANGVDQEAKGIHSDGFSLWADMRRCLGGLQPRWVFLESLANILRFEDAFGGLLQDLATLGYDVSWDCVPAAAFGAPHRRDRLFLCAADLRRERRSHSSGERKVADLDRVRRNDHEEDRSVADSRGVAVDWGSYATTIERWEEITGRPCPEPLVRRVDARAAQRLERFRTRSVCDGVLVQIAQYYGEKIMAEEERLAKGILVPPVQYYYPHTRQNHKIGLCCLDGIR